MDFLKKLFGIIPEGEPINIDKERLEAKYKADAERQKKMMGNKYLCHPDNFVQKREVTDRRYWSY